VQKGIEGSFGNITLGVSLDNHYGCQDALINNTGVKVCPHLRLADHTVARDPWY
jgi:hypothetical protein